MSDRQLRDLHERRHGEALARSDPEAVWGWKSPAGQARAARRGARIAVGAGLRPGMRVLEVGCGTGVFTEIFARTGAEITAIDISEDLLVGARARDWGETTVELVCGRLEDIPASGTFDAIVGSSVLHHLDLEPTLESMLRLLRPGGVVSFAEPNFLNPQVFLERTARFLPIFSYVSPDETAFVRWRLADLLRDRGFSEIEIVPFDWLHPATPTPLIPAVTRLGALLERVLGIREFSGSLYIRCRALSTPT